MSLQHLFLAFTVIGWPIAAPLFSTQTQNRDATLDQKVQTFLERHAHQWHDLNVPAKDGRFLYDLVLKNKYRQALEIGTSTGHSAIWIAWALSKTGGKLITIEIDEWRCREALKNFRAAGLTDFIDLRQADAHELVGQLAGPFDFVFCDADKEWYKNYFIAVAPQIKVGGCFTAHNVYGPYRSPRGIAEFIAYVKSQANFSTYIEQEKSTGISVSFKKEN